MTKFKLLKRECEEGRERGGPCLNSTIGSSSIDRKTVRDKKHADPSCAICLQELA